MQRKDIETFQKSTLSSGIRVITEEINSVKSISIGIWVKTGSRNETTEQAGITHFLEHMMFKGTASRNAYEIALGMESVGGYLNAFTASEYTCYYARCLNTQLDRAVDILTDMVLNSTFPEEEIEKEKKVVIEEMKMYRDSPEDFLFEEFTSRIFDGHPLGRPIIGFEDTVSSFNRKQLFDYVEQRYSSENVFIAVAGNVKHEQLVQLAEKAFTQKLSGSSNSSNPALPEEKVGKYTLTKPIEQAHYIFGRRGLSSNHDDKYLLLLANSVLSGGMSSRLHQNIREKYGYCYSVQTFNQSFFDTGLFGVYVGTDKEYIDHVRELIVKEFEDIRTKEIPQKEFEEAKTQLKGKLLLSQESTSNRMTRLAKSELYFNRFVSLDELVENIDSVTADKVLEFSNDFFNSKRYSEGILYPEV